MSSRFGFGEDFPQAETLKSGNLGQYSVSESASVDELWGARQRLSPIPILVAAGALIVSAGLILIGRAWPFPFVGWILTPFVVVGCLVWARALAVRNSGNPMFDREDARKRLRVLQALTFLAFIASLPHVWRIGQEVALWLQ